MWKLARELRRIKPKTNQYISARWFTENTNCRHDRNKVVVTLPGIDLTLGGKLSELQVTYEQWGDTTLSDSRTVVIFPSFSHSSHAASSRDDPRPGWWENIVGPGKAINTSYFRVICPSVLGSPYGSTSPLSINPETGKQFKADFPQIVPQDMVCT